MLVESGVYRQVVQALLDCVIADAHSPGGGEELNVAMDLLAFTLYQLYSCKAIAQEAVDSAALNELRDIFIMVIKCDKLWPITIKYFEFHEKTLFVARLLHVIASFKDIAVLKMLHEKFEKHNMIHNLVQLMSYAEYPPNVTEMLLLALGTLAGSAGYFPWEIKLIMMKRAEGINGKGGHLGGGGGGAGGRGG